MRIEELGLVFGDAMQIQVADKKEQRYPVRFYGINPSSSVIVSAPTTGPGKMLFLREGTNVTLRFVAKNVASGFTTRVLITRGQPYPYIHLAIPKEIETVEVRKEVRVSTDIPVTIINKTNSSSAVAAKILNMSCSGYLVETNSAVADKKDLLNLTAKLLIADVQQLVTADALVTYIKQVDDEEKYLYGVNIEKIDQDDMIVLRAFVYQELLKNFHLI